MGQSPNGSSYNENGNGTVFYQGRAEFGWRYPTRRLSTTEPKRMAKCGDVLMSVRAPVGDLNLAYEDCCIGRGLAAIHCEHSSFCLYLMRSLRDKLDAFNGEGTVFGSINGKALKGLPIALPGPSEIKGFENEVSFIDGLIRNNETESRSLMALRDTLLPKLISGEIDVSKIDLKLLNSHLAEALLPFKCHALVAQKWGSPHFCGLPRTSNYRITVPPGAAPLLPKDRGEQAFSFGLLLSVRALGSCRHLPWLFAASTAHDLV